MCIFGYDNINPTSQVHYHNKAARVSMLQIRHRGIEMILIAIFCQKRLTYRLDISECWHNVIVMP